MVPDLTPRVFCLLGEQMGRKAWCQSEGKAVSTEGSPEEGLG